MCAAKIRQGRADELGTAVTRWLRAGGGVEFVTLTVEHHQADELDELLQLVADGWRVGVLAGRRFRDERATFGISAWVRTVEVTLGQYGWHPHIHALLFTDRPLTASRRSSLASALFGRWSSWIERTSGRRCSPDAFRMVPGVAGVGEYLAKMQDGPTRHLGMELARSDLKTGRRTSCTPFELLSAAADGEAWALRRWWEWERATKGRRCLTWSRGGRAVLGLVEDEPTDQELAEAEVGGDVAAVIDGRTWALLARMLGADAALLDAVELDGSAGAGRYLATLPRCQAGPAP